MDVEVTDQPKTGLRALPRSIWALGLVSLFMDISSEMIHGLLPVFLTTVLGASTELVGLIEGVGEATAAIGKLFSGWLSDKIGKRKALAVFGYGLAALSKPLFAIAPTPLLVLAARFSDRIGKGMRDAPRDALISDIVAQGHRGAAFGLRQALDTIGAFAGPLLAIALMALLNDNFRDVFWFAVIPGLISVLILVIGVEEPPRQSAETPETGIQGPQGNRGHLLDHRRHGRSADAGALLRSLPDPARATCGPLARPRAARAGRHEHRLFGGRLSARGAVGPGGPQADAGIGFAVLIVSDIVLALAPNLMIVMAGVALWGLHMAVTQGLLSALVANSAPPHLRATAFGFFNFVSGTALLLASVIAGFLWEDIGPSATFFAGAAFTALGLLTLFITRQYNPVR